MSLDIRWLVPAAIYAFAPQCIAAKYMSVEQARALIFPFADEFVINRCNSHRSKCSTN